MITLAELEIWFKDVHSIIVDLYISMNNAKRLSVIKYKHEERVKNHGFMVHQWHQMRFTMIIQLAKLFSGSKSQKRSFNKLCNRLENQKLGKDIEEQLEKNSTAFARVFRTKEDIKNAVKTTRKELSEHHELIRKIEKLRDQVYAHSDPNPDRVPISMEELEKLIRLSDKMFNRIRGQLFNIHADMARTPDWDIDYVLEGLAAHIEHKIDQFGKKTE